MESPENPSNYCVLRRSNLYVKPIWYISTSGGEGRFFLFNPIRRGEAFSSLDGPGSNPLVIGRMLKAVWSYRRFCHWECSESHLKTLQISVCVGKKVDIASTGGSRNESTDR